MMKISKQGYSTIAVVLLVAILLALLATLLPTGLAWVIWSLAFVGSALVIYFFRDPERTIPTQANVLLSPADGKIVSIRMEEEPEYYQQKVQCISIFLSPLDVHINRVPVTGMVDYVRYYPGKFLMAWKEEASLENERAHFGITNPNGIRVMFKQITGFLARRTVYNLHEGDEVLAGDRFGLMKFSSRMDVLLPLDVDIQVREGERTVAGETVLAMLPTVRNGNTERSGITESTGSTESTATIMAASSNESEKTTHVASSEEAQRPS